MPVPHLGTHPGSAAPGPRESPQFVADSACILTIPLPLGRIPVRHKPGKEPSKVPAFSDGGT
jgi:hypothetical protein